MILVEKFCSLITFCSNQLHIRKLNGVLGSETSDSSLDHPNFPCPFCTKIFDEKTEVFEHLDTCDGTAMILLSVMRMIISTTATTLMIPLCSFCPKIFKEKAEMIEPFGVQRYKHIGIFMVSFLSRQPYEN